MAKREGISVKKRFVILTRDHYCCQYCGRSAPAVPLCVDHCIPVAAGGINEDFNLVTACEECNLGKSATVLNRLQLRSAFRQLCDKTISTFPPEDKQEVDFVKMFLEGAVYSVAHWCQPNLDFLCASIQALLNAGHGRDFSLMVAMGLPEGEDAMLRLSASLILFSLGPAPALISAAKLGLSIKDVDKIKPLIDGWIEELEPINKWRIGRSAEGISK